MWSPLPTQEAGVSFLGIPGGLGGGKGEPGKGVCFGADVGTETAKVRSSKIHGRVNIPGGPVAKTLHSQCRGLGFDPWSEN